MRFLRKIIGVACLFAGFAGSGWSQQGQNAINQIVINNQTITAATTLYTSDPLQNIGQTSHQITVNVFYPTANTHTDNISASVEGSLDGVNWVNIGPWLNQIIPYAGVSVTGGQVCTYTVSGFQYYPYVRTYIVFTIVSGDSLTVNAQYQGNVNTAHNIVDNSAVDAGMIFAPITASGGTGGAYTALTPVISSTNLGNPFVYGMTLNIPATTAQIIIGCGNASTISTQQMLLEGPFGATSTGLVSIWPVEIRAMMGCQAGNTITMFVQSTTGTTGVSGELIYRNE